MFAAWLRAFDATLAKVSRRVPWRQRYSRPAPPNICAAGGAWLKPCSRLMTPAWFSSGLARSVYLEPMAPFSIFSKPSASTHSASPPSIACRARNSAVEPVEQLLLTLITGMPVSPTP